VSLIIGIFIGAFIGIMLMCLLQINTVADYERTINNLEKKLSERK